MPGLLPRPAFAQDIGDRVILATWPNYHDPANFDAFAEATGASVQMNVFGSNEEMLAKLQAGGSGLGRVRADELHHHHLCRTRI